MIRLKNEKSSCILVAHLSIARLLGSLMAFHRWTYSVFSWQYPLCYIWMNICHPLFLSLSLAYNIIQSSQFISPFIFLWPQYSFFVCACKFHSFLWPTEQYEYEYQFKRNKITEDPDWVKWSLYFCCFQEFGLL